MIRRKVLGGRTLGSSSCLARSMRVVAQPLPCVRCLIGFGITLANYVTSPFRFRDSWCVGAAPGICARWDDDAVRFVDNDAGDFLRFTGMYNHLCLCQSTYNVFLVLLSSARWESFIDVRVDASLLSSGILIHPPTAWAP